MDYGKAIRTLRASRKLTQKELAVRIGADASFLSLLEGNRRSPSTETLEDISRVLDVPMYLLVLLATEPTDAGKLPGDELSRFGKDLLSSLMTVPALPKRGGKKAGRHAKH